jgi:hypothetical protein
LGAKDASPEAAVILPDALAGKRMMTSFFFAAVFIGTVSFGTVDLRTGGRNFTGTTGLAADLSRVVIVDLIAGFLEATWPGGLGAALTTERVAGACGLLIGVVLGACFEGEIALAGVLVAAVFEDAGLLVCVLVVLLP